MESMSLNAITLQYYFNMTMIGLLAVALIFIIWNMLRLFKEHLKNKSYEEKIKSSYQSMLSSVFDAIHPDDPINHPEAFKENKKRITNLLSKLLRLKNALHNIQETRSQKEYISFEPKHWQAAKKEKFDLETKEEFIQKELEIIEQSIIKTQEKIQEIEEKEYLVKKIHFSSHETITEIAKEESFLQLIELKIKEVLEEKNKEEKEVDNQINTQLMMSISPDAGMAPMGIINNQSYLYLNCELLEEKIKDLNFLLETPSFKKTHLSLSSLYDLTLKCSAIIKNQCSKDKENFDSNLQNFSFELFENIEKMKSLLSEIKAAHHKAAIKIIINL